MFGRLLPREDRFFEFFNAHAAQVVLGARELVALMDNLGEAEQRISTIEAIEQRGDRIAHDTVTLLHKSFITPLDRDEIHGLISAMDDVLDCIQDVGESIQLYNMSYVGQDAKRLAALSLSCCERVKTVVALINEKDAASAVLQTCREIDQLESEADRVMRSAVSRLFREERDALQVIKFKEIYRLLESITDRCEDVGKIVEGIVLENA